MNSHTLGMGNGRKKGGDGSKIFLAKQHDKQFCSTLGGVKGEGRRAGKKPQDKPILTPHRVKRREKSKVRKGKKGVTGEQLVLCGGVPV